MSTASKHAASSTRRIFLSIIGIALFLLCATLFLIINATFRNWDSQESIAASDTYSVAFGDGAHAVPITSTAVLSVGQSENLDSLRITVINANEVTKGIRNKDGVPVTAVGYVFWEVHFTIENISNNQKWPHPSVDSQIQYVVNGANTWIPEDEGVCTPSITKSVPTLEPGAKFDCKFIYHVPQNDQPVYWVFSTIGYESSVVFRVR